MPITVRHLCKRSELGISVRAGAANLDRELTWAHVSELDDPTAFLSGGELLLTTGVALPEAAGGVEEYVRRLAAAGIAAVGFGVGLRYESIPAAFVQAAIGEDIPLLEIPLDVPFIQLAKTVSQALSSDDHARLQKSHQNQRRLIHATLAVDGARTLVRRTADLIGGWAALLDATGRILDSSHGGIGRAVRRTKDAREARPREVVFSTEGGEDIISQPLVGVDSTVLGYLVAGREGVVGSLDHGVVTTAASLLTLFTRRSEQARDMLGRARSVALALLTQGNADTIRPVAGDLWGGLPAEPVQAISAHGEDPVLARAVQVLDSSPDGATAFALVDGELVVGTDHVESAIARLRSIAGLRLGVSTHVTWGDFARAVDESRDAAARATTDGRPVHYSEMVSGGIGEFLDRDRARSFARAHLSILDGDGGDMGVQLRATLCCWLAHNGHTDPAAKELGIHRHTLRRRLVRVEELLGVCLESPTTRAELWLELSLTGDVTAQSSPSAATRSR